MAHDPNRPCRSLRCCQETGDVRYKGNVSQNAGAGASVTVFERNILYPMKHGTQITHDNTCLGALGNRPFQMLGSRCIS